MIRKREFSSSTTRAECYTLENEFLRVEVLSYGARIKAIYTKDKDGQEEDVVLGYDDLASYEQDHAYFGALVGRCAGRIAKGHFTLEGTTYTLDCNNGEHHLHGGKRGFSFQVFDGEIVQDTLQLRYHSAHMEEGYPGAVSLLVSYRLEKDSLCIDYEAISDRTTLLNLTNHSYFNLHGAGKGSVSSHIVQMHASSYYPNNAHFLPDHMESVQSTPFDFRIKKPLSSIFEDDKNPQLIQANGLDHYFLFSSKQQPCVQIYEPSNGRILEILSDQLGAQIYTPFYSPAIIGKKKIPYEGRCALCVETQGVSNSINQGSCTVLLKPEEVYTQHTKFRFTNTKENPYDFY